MMHISPFPATIALAAPCPFPFEADMGGSLGGGLVGASDQVRPGQFGSRRLEGEYASTID